MNSNILNNIANYIFCGKHSTKYLFIFYIILIGAVWFLPTATDRIKNYLKIEHEKLQLVDERLKIIEEIIYKNKK